MPNPLSIFNFRNRNPLTAIVLFIGLVVVLEICFSFLPPNALVRAFEDHAVAKTPAADVSIMGDSVAESGLLADHLAGILPNGKTVANNAIPATGPEFP